MNPVDSDEPFVSVLKEQPLRLKEAYSRLIAAGPLPINSVAVTTAILSRLRAYFLAQREIKQFLNKIYSGAASDFFVETVLFYMRALAETHKLGVEVMSERKFTTPHGPLRPDISLWKGARVLALVECKITQANLLADIERGPIPMFD